MLYSASDNALRIVFSNSSHEHSAKLATCQTFKKRKRRIVGARLAGGSVTETATLLGVSRAAISKVMMAYTNHGKTGESNSGRKPKISETDRRTLQRVLSNNQRTTAIKVTAELNIYLEDPVSTKTFRRELHKSYLHGRAATTKPLITKNNAKMRKHGVMIVKPGL
jgi:transposase